MFSSALYSVSITICVDCMSDPNVCMNPQPQRWTGMGTSPPKRHQWYGCPGAGWQWILGSGLTSLLLSTSDEDLCVTGAFVALQAMADLGVRAAAGTWPTTSPGSSCGSGCAPTSPQHSEVTNTNTNTNLSMNAPPASLVEIHVLTPRGAEAVATFLFNTDQVWLRATCRPQGVVDVTRPARPRHHALTWRFVFGRMGSTVEQVLATTDFDYLAVAVRVDRTSAHGSEHAQTSQTSGVVVQEGVGITVCLGFLVTGPGHTCPTTFPAMEAWTTRLTYIVCNESVCQTGLQDLAHRGFMIRPRDAPAAARAWDQDHHAAKLAPNLAQVTLGEVSTAIHGPEESWPCLVGDDCDVAQLTSFMQDAVWKGIHQAVAVCLGMAPTMSPLTLSADQVLGVLMDTPNL